MVGLPARNDSAKRAAGGDHHRRSSVPRTIRGDDRKDSSDAVRAAAPRLSPAGWTAGAAHEFLDVAEHPLLIATERKMVDAGQLDESRAVRDSALRVLAIGWLDQGRLVIQQQSASAARP